MQFLPTEWLCDRLREACDKWHDHDFVVPFFATQLQKKQQPAFGWKPASFLPKKVKIVKIWIFRLGYRCDNVRGIRIVCWAKSIMVIQNDRTWALLMTWLPPEWLYHFQNHSSPPKKKAHPLSHFSTKSTLSFPSPKGIIDRNNWEIFPLNITKTSPSSAISRFSSFHLFPHLACEAQTVCHRLPSQCHTLTRRRRQGRGRRGRRCDVPRDRGARHEVGESRMSSGRSAQPNRWSQGFLEKTIDFCRCCLFKNGKCDMNKA